MKYRNLKARIRNSLVLLCAVSLVSVQALSVSATNIDKLEQETAALQSELNNLQNTLNTLSSEITELTEKINTTNESIEKTELDLAAAKLNEDMQYDAMKKRIKFLYETGNPSFIDMICNSESMAEFLNKSEFIKSITEYDRELLSELEIAQEEIAKKEADLQQEKATLQEMQEELNSQKASLNEAISSASGRLEESSEALANAKKAQNAANNNSSSNNNTSNDSNSNQGSVSTDDLVLLAALLQCEAGTSNYDALLAVATVVMNRVESGRFPNTLYDVIYQKGQFSPTWNGSLKKVLANGPASLCYTVARDALNGKRLDKVQGCLFFNASWATNRNGVKVGGNIFW